MQIQLGTVWHFSIAVRDPEKHAQYWTSNFALKEMFRSDEAIALTNDDLIIAFFKGTPHPDTYRSVRLPATDSDELWLSLAHYSRQEVGSRRISQVPMLTFRT
jgi:hypothetical protein